MQSPQQIFLIILLLQLNTSMIIKLTRKVNFKQITQKLQIFAKSVHLTLNWKHKFNYLGAKNFDVFSME